MKLRQKTFSMRVLLCFSAASILLCSFAHAEQPFLSLEVESVILNWQDEFVLQLTIYGPEGMELPPVTIDGLDQFELQGTGKNLLQIPRGKTKKWVLTYTLLASETGNFKVGPAVLTHEGHNYRSNIVFITVEGPAPARKIQTPKKSPAAPEAQQEKPSKQEKKRPPEEEPRPVEKDHVKPPVVMSASQIGDRILILMETRKPRPHQLEGIPVTVRLLSQLPVENLEFLEEADFPGFLRYDFPFTSKPKGEIVSYKNKNYASYELVKFLLFPLERGRIGIPPVRCALKVRVPSGAFPEADLKLDLERSSNLLHLNVSPSPEGAVVGDFVLKNEVASDEPQSKIVRMILEGKGQLSTFNFPEVAGPNFEARKLGASITAKIEGESLYSRKVQEVEIIPIESATTIVLPEIKVREFDPESESTAFLKLPPMNFAFTLPGASPRVKLEFPRTGGGKVWILFLLAGSLNLFTYLRYYRPVKRHGRVRLQRLFADKNLKLQISKSAARRLYQEITKQIGHQERSVSSLNDSIVKHLPQEEWLNVQRGLRKLEHTAYSPARSTAVTYGEMKRLCETIEALWIQ